MIAQKFCLIKKSGLNPAACQFPEGEVGRTGIHHFIQPLINDSAFGCVSCQRGSRCLQWNKTPSSAEKFSSSAGRSGSSSPAPCFQQQKVCVCSSLKAAKGSFCLCKLWWPWDGCRGPQGSPEEASKDQEVIQELEHFTDRLGELAMFSLKKAPGSP